MLGLRRVHGLAPRSRWEVAALRFKLEYNKRVNLIGARSEREFVLQIGAFCLCIYWTRAPRRGDDDRLVNES